ncbi:MAG: MMB_0454 family protein [Metamycoplasmataceae bacterium]
MEYISIKNSTNQTTNIHKKVFADIVKMMTDKLEDVKIVNEPFVLIVRVGKNIRLSFDFTISKKSDSFTTINNIKKFIIETFVLLFDIKPYNILMNYKGRH